MYQWQDIVISVVSILFGFMLFPQIADSIKGKTVNIFSAGLTTIGLYILAGTFATLELWFSVVAELFVGTAWLVLFILSYTHRKKTR